MSMTRSEIIWDIIHQCHRLHGKWELSIVDTVLSRTDYDRSEVLPVYRDIVYGKCNACPGFDTCPGFTRVLTCPNIPD